MSNNFCETVFLKEGSIQDSQYEKLKNNPKANRDGLYMLEKGIAGEKQLMYHLKKSNIGMYALRDIYFKEGEFTAQVDFIIITSHHCYFVECKNYDGDIIHVDETRQFVLSTRYGKKYNRMGIQSPLSQVDNQLNVLQKICEKKPEEVKEVLKGKEFSNYFKTLVVFANPNCILDLKKAPKDIKYKILKVDNLVRQIEYDDSHYKGKRLSQEDMKNVAEFILKNNTVRTDYVIDRPIPIETSNNYNDNSNQNDLLKQIGIIILCLIIMIASIMFVFAWLNHISKKPANNQKPVYNENLPTQKSTPLTDSQRKAFTILKSGYENSKRDGFEVIHTSICKEISGMVDGKMNCAGNPMIVNFKEDGETITILKSFTCYTLVINDNNELISTNSEYVGYDLEQKCSGIPVGIIEWDNENEYYQKIGGYNKIKEMAMYMYNNKNIEIYYDYSHIEERGGNQQLFSTYKMTVDRFFSGVTGTTMTDTTKDKFNEMVQYYYYIMK